eukprot:SAG22_NODE_346_length_11892_cov_40.205970_4_plen_116_part_00
MRCDSARFLLPCLVLSHTVPCLRVTCRPLPADLNNDGHDDIIVSNSDALNQLFLGDGRGGFKELDANGVLAVGGMSCFMVTADVNGDGRLDMFSLQHGGLVHNLVSWLDSYPRHL